MVVTWTTPDLEADVAEGEAEKIGNAIASMHGY